jgi:alanine racemase
MTSSWIEINTFALIQNVRIVRRLIGDMPLWAVVKANAYGHDMALATEAFWRGGVDGFVVADVADAKQMSEARYKLPVLVLHPISEDLLNVASQQGWHLAITSMDYFQRIEHFVTMRQKPISIHLELETGMHRTGILPLEIESIIEKTHHPDSRLKVTGLFTHLFTPFSGSVSRKQIMAMEELRFSLQRKGLPVPITHVFSSKGLGLYGEEYMFDAVRIGAALYGFSPQFSDTTPALAWKTKVIHLGQLQPGETVGYDGSFEAKYRTRIATLPVGYANGLDRRLGNNGAVLVGGKPCPIIGKVSMNHTMIDITSVFKVEMGEEVVLIGTQGNNSIMLCDIAKWIGTTEYEVVTGISALLPRIKTK